MTTFKKATRTAQKLKIGIAGPTGSGKTDGALSLALALAAGGRIAVADTENGSASLYADRYDFDTLDIQPPYLTRKYLDAMQAAVEGGYAVLVIDSLSHQWDGEGGILQRKTQADAKPGSNTWTNWGPFTKEHEEFKAAILHAPLHIIATMRSKMAYQQTENGGKKRVEKLGLQPIQREGMEYEFALAFDLAMDHLADASKDRTRLFDGRRVDLRDPATGKALLAWLADAAPVPTPTPTEAQTDALVSINEMLQGVDPEMAAKVRAALAKGNDPLKVLARLTDHLLTTGGAQ